MDKKEYEEIEKSANILEHDASTRCNTEIQKAQNIGFTTVISRG